MTDGDKKVATIRLAKDSDSDSEQSVVNIFERFPSNVSALRALKGHVEEILMHDGFIHQMFDGRRSYMYGINMEESHRQEDEQRQFWAKH